MRTNALEKGSVFYFPYLWQWQFENGLETSKDRVSCLAFRAPQTNGAIVLVIVAISDRETDWCLKIPVGEKKLAGLKKERDAYLHLGEYNLDPLEGSVEMPSKPVILGRFSETFMRKVTDKLAEGIRNRQSKAVNRKAEKR
jgi:hypothetical protein